MPDQNIRIQPPLWLPILVAVLVGGAYISGKYIETRDNTPFTITVNGEGKISAAPDIASLQFGVTTVRHATAEETMTELSDKMNAAIAAVKALGIEEKDIMTQSLSLYPAYDWTEGERIDRGFEASQSLTVKVRDTAKIGEVLTAATSAGANQAGGVSFTIDEPEALQEQARQEAIADAQQKAQELAMQLGKRLGEMKGFSEGGYGMPMPMYKEEMMRAYDSAESGGATPAMMNVPAGEQEVVVTVSIMYEIE